MYKDQERSFLSKRLTSTTYKKTHKQSVASNVPAFSNFVISLHGYYEGYSRTFWFSNGKGGVHDMGVVALETITSAPDKSMGVGELEYYDTQPAEIHLGHTYCVVTSDGAHYAKLRVTDVSVMFTRKVGYQLL